jgi:hypothetical protein
MTDSVNVAVRRAASMGRSWGYGESIRWSATARTRPYRRAQLARSACALRAIPPPIGQLATITMDAQYSAVHSSALVTMIRARCAGIEGGSRRG